MDWKKGTNAPKASIEKAQATRKAWSDEQKAHFADAMKKGRVSCSKAAKHICHIKNQTCRAIGVPVGTKAGPYTTPSGEAVRLTSVVNRAPKGMAGVKKTGYICYTPSAEQAARQKMIANATPVQNAFTDAQTACKDEARTKGSTDAINPKNNRPFKSAFNQCISEKLRGKVSLSSVL